MAFRTNKTPVLQEKSASGSVATFNTALAMPLASCNIAVNAWQEGSGDPSPVNNRPIHGFSEVNATRAGKNLFDGTYGNRFNLFIPKNTAFTVSTANTSANTYIMLYDKNGDSITQYAITNIDSTTNRKYNNIPNTINVDIYQVRFFNSSSGDYQISYSSDTAYEPYVTPTIYTIQLGQEVYGAEVDVDNGIVYSTRACDLLTPDNVYYVYNQNEDRIIIKCNDFRTVKPLNENTQICTHLIANAQAHDIDNTVVNSFIKGAQSGVIYMKFDKTFIADLNAFKTWITSEYNNNTPVKIVYDYNDNFPLQTPTQIETLIGNNTIFADTGEVDLTYKDLDIAKRGNFREVFKLPS